MDIQLDKLEISILSRLREKTGKSNEDIIKLAIFELDTLLRQQAEPEPDVDSKPEPPSFPKMPPPYPYDFPSFPTLPENPYPGVKPYYPNTPYYPTIPEYNSYPGLLPRYTLTTDTDFDFEVTDSIKDFDFTLY